MNDNNSAMRLWTILSEAQRCPNDWTIQKVFATVFDIVPPDSTPLLFRSLASAEDLIQDIEQKIGNIKNANCGLYLDWPDRVRQVFRPQHIVGKWEHHKGLIDKADLKSIQFCANLLAQHYPESAISADELKRILDSAQQLETEILASTLPL